MIKGIGMDLVNLDRIEQALKNERFVRRILTEQEWDVFQTLKERRQVEFLGGRFAGKEAFAKAFGTGIGPALSWQDINILNNEQGRPVLTASVLTALEKGHISLTHTNELASAYVIIESLSG